VAPWSGFWERNGFASILPALEPLLSNPYFRGAVSGVGAVTAVAGLAEIGGALGARRARQTTPEQKFGV
jgi:hypothetical protein